MVVSGYVLCFVPTDIKYFLRYRESLSRAWNEVLASGEETDLPESAPEVGFRRVEKGRKGFACRVAVKAISEVGLLKPTKANALVYQKVVLKVLSDMRVRYVDRVRILPHAIAACLDRPEEVSKVEGCIALLTKEPLST
jgi:hypothetical protein